MSYRSRIIVYLKGPTNGNPAVMNARAFTNPAYMVQESDLTASGSGLRQINRNQEVLFTLATTRGICDAYGLMITWPGGCRITVQTLLGEKGAGVGDEIGVDYDRTGVSPPCDAIYCRFNGAGVLTYEDRQGVTVTMDTCKPGVSGLCLTLVPRLGCTGSATFPGGEFANLTV